MAISGNNSGSGLTKETFKVVSRRDDALAEDLTDSEWDSYKETLDESVLRFVAGKSPTRFVMRSSLSFAAKKVIANEQIGIGANGKPTFQFGFTLDEVRCALVDVENPADLPAESHIVFKKDASGMNASEELIAFLDDLGIAAELYAARQVKNKATLPKK